MSKSSDVIDRGEVTQSDDAEATHGAPSEPFNLMVLKTQPGER